MTVRIPYDLHDELAQFAHAKRWNMSDCVHWLIERQLHPGRGIGRAGTVRAAKPAAIDRQESRHA